MKKYRSQRGAWWEEATKRQYREINEDTDAAGGERQLQTGFYGNTET